MGIKLQFNPSTGKLSYNTSTGKVQIVDDGGGGVPIACSDCSPPPATLQVVFSGVSVCCFTFPTVPGRSDSYSAGMSTEINTTHVLTNIGGCVFTKSFAVTETYNVYNTNETCSGTPDVTANVTSIGIRCELTTLGDYSVLITANQPAIGTQIQAWQESAVSPCWSQTLSTPKEVNCGDISFFSLFQTAAFAGGTAIISEVP